MDEISFLCIYWLLWCKSYFLLFIIIFTTRFQTSFKKMWKPDHVVCLFVLLPLLCYNPNLHPYDIYMLGITIWPGLWKWVGMRVYQNETGSFEVKMKEKELHTFLKEKYPFENVLTSLIKLLFFFVFFSCIYEIF